MAAKKALETVTDLDLKRYVGRWFEISSIPSSFQPKDTVNTMAHYTLKEDGTVGVLNETFTRQGKRNSIEGKAWKIDPASAAAEFKVQFWVPPFLPLVPVRGDYYVMALDQAEYKYALIGQPSRKFLWVLSRTPTLAEETYAELLKVAEAQGYDVSLLHRTEHTPDSGVSSTEPGMFEGGRLERTAVAAAVVAGIAAIVASTSILRKKTSSD
ncbi:lipocalin protein [Klebsormidium nitens]|uniref:Lipocalin protein n=1 Tax=Klebsormidium nitens TaxID=105231 RepID=A0A1Y1IQS3_KLENI|nr:lipocalin protein [Klebsormidium nitens]|eukprot:GAQ92392.1 lipocalin protein [Klebsormidium nitens]